MKETFKGTYQRLKFLNKFFLYSELSKHTENQAQGKEIYQKPLEKYEAEVMKIFNCKPESWPVCLFDFTYKNKIPQFLCFRTSKEAPQFIDDYFYREHSGFQRQEELKTV